MKTKQLDISCEFFPPKTPEGVEALTSTAQVLSAHPIQFFSVTFGAGGSTRSGTIETVQQLQHITSVSIVPHLSCVGVAKAEIVELLAIYKEMGVKRIIALRGDLPSGMVQSGDFKYANDLITFIRAQTGTYFHIDVAAYPEIHPQAHSAQADILNLKRKFDAGADSAITQYFYNPDAYFRFIDECAKVGITQPIVPGIMPITQYVRLARFSDMCGAEIPRWIRKRLEGYGDDIESMRAFGLEVVVELCQQLIARKTPGLHFYTLNKHQATIAVLNALGIYKQEKIVKIR